MDSSLFPLGLILVLSTVTMPSELSSFEWSICSRTCGGGVRSRQLIANNNAESRVEHQLCNEVQCPRGRLGFREAQCSWFDDVPGLGRHRWIPAHSAGKPCQLLCQTRDTGNLVSFGPSSDGTPCSTRHMAVCVGGKCLNVLCDGRVVDDPVNSTCRRVRKVARGQKSRPGIAGYSEVAEIPEGATRIFIAENGTNHVAVYDKTRHEFILNGDWLVSLPGTVSGAGTDFTYTRLRDSETLSAPGPINASIQLMVLGNESLSIVYEYWVLSSTEDNTKEPDEKRPRQSFSSVSGTQPSRSKRGRKIRCRQCPKDLDRIREFCISDFVVRATVVSEEEVADFKRFELHVQESLRNTIPLREKEFVWMGARDPCSCPRLKIGRQYVLLGRADEMLATGTRSETRLLVQHGSHVRRWSRGFVRKLRRQEKRLCPNYT